MKLGYTLIKTLDNKFYVKLDTKEVNNKNILGSSIEVTEEKFNLLVDSTSAEVMEIPF